jgi:hypothetical protein
MVAQALIVKQHARDNQGPGQRSATRLVGAGDEASA